MVTDNGQNLGGERDAVIFGATNLVGRHLLHRVAERGFSGLCLSRLVPPIRDALPPGIHWSTVSSDDVLQIPPHATIFSLVPMPALPPLLARTAGGNRLIALSTSSAIYKAESPDPAERRLARDFRQAEDEVQRLCYDKGIAWTIFRPALIYDPGRDRNVSAIATFIRRFGVFPIVWPGTGLRQPIHADDVARAMIATLNVPGAAGTLFNLPGGETLPYREMVRRVFQALGRRPAPLYLPHGFARMAFYAWRSVTGAQYSIASLERMNMDLVLDPAPARDALGITCRPFQLDFSDWAAARRA